MDLQVVDKQNKKISGIALSELAEEKINSDVLYYAVKAARNNLRHGTAAVKDRSQINKTNKKAYRQKGTGNARHGSKRANIYVGGASAHGPRPRSYVESVNKTFKLRSYQEVFKYLIKEDKLKVLKDLTFAKPSTKEAVAVLKNLNLTKSLVVLPPENRNAVLSFRNIKNIGVCHEMNLNVLKILQFDSVIMTESYFNQVKERYGL